MLIVLFSSDVKLLRLCRDVLADLSPDSEIALTDFRTPLSVPADVTIWDADDQFPTSAESGPALHYGSGEQIFLVGRKLVQSFLERLPLGAGTTVLKPVRPCTLRIFLDAALQKRRKRANSGPPISESGDLLQCLLLANLKLQEFDQDRTNFLARAVHDFRAPLTAVNGYCGVLQQQILGPLNADQLGALERMQYSLRKLTRMASAMLQLSTAQHVDRPPELRDAQIEACVNHALAEIAPTAGEKNIDISANFTDPGAPLYLESQQIEQVLVNLLENACKFTPRGGHIEIRGYAVAWPCAHGRSVRSGDEHQSLSAPTAYRIDVRDTGTGFPPGYLECAFEECTSYSNVGQRSAGGLGLAICKMILTVHGGEIWAENDAAGATVSFVLPFHNAKSERAIKPSGHPLASRAS